MLCVQEYLAGGKSLDDLRAELGIRVAEHPTEPLVRDVSGRVGSRRGS